MSQNNSMWAFLQPGPSRLELGEAPMPTADEVPDGQVLLRTIAGGVCGSDIPFFQGHRAPHVPVGMPGFSLHEVVGEVVISKHPDFGVGELVVGWATMNTGLAEYVVTAGHSLHAYSPGYTADQAIALQPLACVIYAVEQLGEVKGRSATVLGQGPIGALFSHVLKDAGASHVIGVDRVDRSDVRELLRVDTAVHHDVTTYVDEMDAADRTNIVVEAIGHQVETLTAAVKAAAYEGEIFYFGINNDDFYPFPMTAFLRKNMTLRSGVTAMPHRRRVLAAADAYLRKYPELLDAYLTSVFDFKDAQSAFEAAVRPKTGQLKVTLTTA